MAKKVLPHGDRFDDGVYDSVKKVCVGEDGGRVSFIAFEYAKGDQSITESHGNKNPQERKQFLLDYENGEYIKSVEGTYDEDCDVSSLTFITSVERDREEFGKKGCNAFKLTELGFDKIVGFRGRSSNDRISALEAHYAVVLVPPVKKLQGEGGDYGLEYWDDGVHDNVSKITITYVNLKVKSVEFEYIHGNYSPLVGDVHGEFNKAHEKKEFVLNEDEYITSVTGFYGEKYNNGSYYMAMISFNTNKDTYQVLGYDEEYKGSRFTFGGVEGYRIVGFHGISTANLEQIGAYVKPIDSS
ncbi:Jacalin-related lectin 45 [Cardamine amara subsp. amara]|uniref:Jacalin-related lectin 45 n=1 Tax=Cardamine amara subsp. amara TaxID=228776 RepID=A0ABD1AS44_CARAN